MKEDITKNSIFVDDGHKQETLALDFAVEEKAKNNKPVSGKKTDTGVEPVVAPAPSETVNKVEQAEVPAAKPLPAASKPLFQKFESDYDDENSPAMPAYRSAVYPAGYTRNQESVSVNERIAAAASVLPAADNIPRQDANVSSRKAQESAERAESEKASVPNPGRKSSSSHHQKSIKTDIAFGKLLYEARSRANMSVAQVAQITKISETYIEALEREDFNTLPPTVYVCAYIRKLSVLYKVDQSKMEQVIEDLKANAEVSISGDVIAHLDIDRALNPESEQKVRNLYWMVGAAALFFIGIVSVAILMLMAPSGGENKKQASATTPSASPSVAISRPAAVFDPASLEKLRVRQSVPVSELSSKH
ncbi:MAG: helix-turn-helix domain-containing protein [Victivallaceae bacterium]